MTRRLGQSADLDIDNVSLNGTGTTGALDGSLTTTAGQSYTITAAPTVSINDAPTGAICRSEHRQRLPQWNWHNRSARWQPYDYCRPVLHDHCGPHSEYQ